MYPVSNFSLWLTENGRYVPGSRRVGHNVFTDTGREWLRQLVVWDTFGPDVAVDARRLRWIGVGSGNLAELTSVGALDSPLTITTGPSEYIRVLGTRTETTNFSVRYETIFDGMSMDFDHHGASVDISEMGLFADVHDGGGTLLSPSVATHAPVAYKSFDPVTKTTTQTLTILWELRF